MRAAVDCGERGRGDVRKEPVGEMTVEESPVAREARRCH